MHNASDKLVLKLKRYIKGHWEPKLPLLTSKFEVQIQNSIKMHMKCTSEAANTKLTG